MKVVRRGGQLHTSIPANFLQLLLLLLIDEAMDVQAMERRGDGVLEDSREVSEGEGEVADVEVDDGKGESAEEIDCLAGLGKIGACCSGSEASRSCLSPRQVVTMASIFSDVATLEYMAS